MKAEELREWVYAATFHNLRNGYPPCQRGHFHNNAQDTLICNLTEALRQVMERVEKLEAGQSIVTPKITEGGTVDYRHAHPQPVLP